MLYRAKFDVISEAYTKDVNSIQLLPSFLEILHMKNDGIATSIQRDSEGRFERAMIGLDPSWFVGGQRIFGIDAAHIKHNSYSGVQIVMVGRYGNVKNRIAAVALAPTEDYASYHWFLSTIIDHGFDLERIPVFTDCHAAIISAAASLNVFHMFCTRHIIGMFF